jgi:hypothetical protein
VINPSGDAAGAKSGDRTTRLADAEAMAVVVAETARQAMAVAQAAVATAMALHVRWSGSRSQLEDHVA